MEIEAAFIGWIRANGGTVSPKIALHDYSATGAGRGVIALERLGKDEVLFTIPRRLLLNARTTQFRDHLGTGRIPKEGWARIMWSIVLERLSGEGSLWGPYFDIVPETFNLPIAWSEEDRGFLAGTSLPGLIGDPERDFCAHFLPHAPKFELTKDLDISRLRDLYFYAGSLVSSYSFTEADGQISMVPMADMLNHQTGHNNARLFFGKEGLRMQAIKEVAAGEQLFNTYGDIGNAELLFRYGYLDSPNPHTVVNASIDEFCDFAQVHQCTRHLPRAFKESSIEGLLSKGAIVTEAPLSERAEPSLDILRWFAKLYPTEEPCKSKGDLLKMATCIKPCIASFLCFKADLYLKADVRPASTNQALALQLVHQEQTILRKYIDYLT